MDTKESVDRCKATTKRGRPCPWPPSPETGLCSSHDPTQREVLRQRGKAGAKRTIEVRAASRRDIVPLRTFAEIQSFVEKMAALAETGGDTDVRRARVGAGLAKEARELLESDLARKAKVLEELLEASPDLRERIAREIDRGA